MATSLLKPDHGARLLFERVSVDDTSAVYRVRLAVVENEVSCEVTIARVDGAMSFSPWTPTTPDAWLLESVRLFLKTLYANHKGDTPAEWPKRLRRWRAPRE